MKHAGATLLTPPPTPKTATTTTNLNNSKSETTDLKIKNKNKLSVILFSPFRFEVIAKFIFLCVLLKLKTAREEGV